MSLPFALATRALDAILARQPSPRSARPTVSCARRCRRPRSARCGSGRATAGSPGWSTSGWSCRRSAWTVTWCSPSPRPSLGRAALHPGLRRGAGQLRLPPGPDPPGRAVVALSYMDSVYEPLTALYEDVIAARRAHRANISPRQHAHHVAVDAGAPGHRRGRVRGHRDAVVDAYREHWLGLVDGGRARRRDRVAGDTDLAARDATVRANLFSPAVDPVWAQVARLLGEPTQSEAIRDELMRNGPLRWPARPPAERVAAAHRR